MFDQSSRNWTASTSSPTNHNQNPIQPPRFLPIDHTTIAFPQPSINVNRLQSAKKKREREKKKKKRAWWPVSVIYSIWWLVVQLYKCSFSSSFFLIYKNSLPSPLLHFLTSTEKIAWLIRLRPSYWTGIMLPHNMQIRTLHIYLLMDVSLSSSFLFFFVSHFRGGIMACFTHITYHACFIQEQKFNSILFWKY